MFGEHRTEHRIRTSQSRCDSFIPVIKEKCGLYLSWWKIMHFQLTNFGYFSLSAALSWSNWEQYLLELIIWFPEGAHYRGLSFKSHYRHNTAFSGWRLAFGMAVMWWFISFALWYLLLHNIVQYKLFITCHNLF